MARVIKKSEIQMPINLIFSAFKDEKNSVFLDSSLQNELGRYSIIGLHPYHTVTYADALTVNQTVVNLSFEAYMKSYLAEHYEENTTNLPIISGAIGYLSYDYGMELEKVSSIHESNRNSDIPYCIFHFYDDFIIEDHKTKDIYLIANGNLSSSEISVEQMEAVIKKIKERLEMDTNLKTEAHLEIDPNIKIKANFTKQAYLEAIEKVIQYIIDGDIYIANLAQNLEIVSPKKPYEVFEKLRKINPSPFGAYLNYDDFQVICASPERFLKMKGNDIETRPIKGTRKKGETPGEDKLLKEELQNSEKDKSELLMIVDLERNDLNKVCIEGSVEVTELFAVEEYATVYHLAATVIGKLKEYYTAIDLIGAAFPGGSITGAPKKRAMEVIDEIEKSKRGIYTGSIGYLALDGSCDLNIIIRTALYKDEKYLLGVGGGITYESDSEFEYEETLQKAKAVLEALR